MGLHPFASIRSNPYYERAPTRASETLHQIPNSITAQSEPKECFSTNFTRAPGETLHRFIELLAWALFGVRSTLLLGTAGILVCAFSLRNLELEQSYTLRVPPCIDVLATTYAMYRILARSDNRRPNTAASYHFLALIVDVGLVPFYIFIALLTKNDSPSVLAWTSVIGGTGSTNAVDIAIWTLAIIMGVLHVFATILSCVMFLAFCRLTRFENTESRLTARPQRQKVDASVQNANSEKSSPASFLQTRSNNDLRYSPPKPKTVINASRLNLALPALPIGTRVLRSGSPSKNSLRFTSHVGASAQSLSGSSFYSDEEGAPPLPRRSSKRRSDVLDVVLSDTFDNDNLEVDEGVVQSSIRASSSIGAFDLSIPGLQRGTLYRSVPQGSPVVSLATNSEWSTRHNSAAMQPLHMNPPTPPPGSRYSKPAEENSSNVHQVKSRHYGDLGVHPDDSNYNNHITALPTGQNGRVVSSSGADIADIGLQSGIGVLDYSKETSYEGASGVIKSGLRGRIVSGKAAEEGRMGEEIVAAEEPTTSTKYSWASGGWFKHRVMW